MIDYAKEQLSRMAPRLTYGGSAVTGGSAYAGQQMHEGFVFGLTEFGVVVGIITAVIGLALQGYFGWQKVKSDRSIAKARIAYYRGHAKDEAKESENEQS